MKSPKGSEGERIRFSLFTQEQAVGDDAEGRGFFSLPGARELGEPVLHSHLLLTPRAGQRRRKRLCSAALFPEAAAAPWEKRTHRG